MRSSSLILNLCKLCIFFKNKRLVLGIIDIEPISLFLDRENLKRGRVGDFLFEISTESRANSSLLNDFSSFKRLDN